MKYAIILPININLNLVNQYNENKNYITYFIIFLKKNILKKL